jgi:hypothetical protein
MEEEEEIRRYVDTKVNPLFGPLMVDLLKDRPNDLVDYTSRWMKNKGRHLCPIPMHFRLKSNPSKDNSLMSTHKNVEDTKSKHSSKSAEKLPPASATAKKVAPSPPPMRGHDKSDEDSEGEDDVATLTAIQKPKNQRPRCSVSAESYGAYNKKGVILYIL